VALTVRRWLLVAGLGSLALAVAYLPPEPQGVMESTVVPPPETQRLDQLNSAYHQIQETLRGVQFRDSIRAALLRHPDSGGVEVAFRLENMLHTTFPDENYALVRSAAQRVWSRLNPRPGARLIIIVTAGYRWQRTYLLPVALDGRTCVATISLDWDVKWLWRRGPTQNSTNLEPWLRDATAPCLYYAVFGDPGPEIEAWLNRRAFAPAYTADWTSSMPRLRFEDNPNRYEYLYYNASFDALACTDGRVARCGPAVEGIPEYFKPSPVRGLAHRVLLPRSMPVENHYLAALVHDMGRERFANFWRSRGSVPDAFLAAFGVPMDAWTAAWARRSVPDLPPFGPTPRPIAVVLGLVMAGVAIAAAAGGVMRRRVG